MLPADGAVARADIEWAANPLVLQLYLGFALAVLAQGVLFFGLIGYALPAFGFDLLDQCRAPVAADLPGQALRLAFDP